MAEKPNLTGIAAALFARNPNNGHAGAAPGAGDAASGAAAKGYKSTPHSLLVTGKQDDTHEFQNGDMIPRQQLAISKCSNCAYSLATRCIKVLVDNTNDSKIHLTRGNVTTSTLELWRCKGITVDVDVSLFTIQLDLSENITLRIHKQLHFEFVVFTDVNKLSIEVVDSGLKWSSEGQKFEEGEQYRLVIKNGTLIAEQILRLENGFPTTQSQNEAWDEKRKVKVPEPDAGAK